MSTIVKAFPSWGVGDSDILLTAETGHITQLIGFQSAAGIQMSINLETAHALVFQLQMAIESAENLNAICEDHDNLFGNT